MKSFPKLYKKSSTGKISEWEISVEEESGHGVINIVHGYIDGKKQHDTKTVTKGKNTGKANETTPVEQATKEAESKWKKQLDKGYVEDLADTDKVVYLPMLAHSYDKRGKDIKFPCIVQRKFDGVRCTAKLNGDVVLLSRKGKKFPHMEHLHPEIRVMIEGHGDALIPDGELYSEELTFQRVVGLVKKETLRGNDAEDMKKIKYRLYDCILPNDPDAVFTIRYQVIEGLSKSLRHIQLTENFIANSEEDIKRLHDQFVAEGYEGAIIRNLNGKYGVNKRSKDLQKYKHFQDEEYEVVGFEEGEGRAAGTVIWVCETQKGQTFRVRPRGTEGERRTWFESGDKYVGGKLTVRYQELTDDGIPRFPVGIAIRDYE
jgi:DNA ligase-1